ncbi:TetR/AcrR family transcriptional regulator [Williamsia maris]|uniref:TetR/AcrR family transcriptional regulator n=1 Tax=Williamsia maris TaxID=72806 RepID=UPI0020A2C603|nr:TetR/AcrR family transcriptional regulator [Williamsia maris]
MPIPTDEEQPDAVTTSRARPEPSRQQVRRAATIDEIKRRSREKLADAGHGGLSLRAVARDMRMSSAAIYRYFPNHSDLVTALCIDAYTALADTIDETRRSRGDNPTSDQIAAAFAAARAWAKAFPHDFALIFGTPVPGYHAPAEATGPAAARAVTTMAQMYAEAFTSGAAQPEPLPAVLDGEKGPLATYLMSMSETPISDDVLVHMHSAWASNLGFIYSELWGNLALLSTNVDAMYDHHLTNILRALGLTNPAPAQT